MLLIAAGVIGFLIGGGAVHVYHAYGTRLRQAVHDKTAPKP